MAMKPIGKMIMKVTANQNQKDLPRFLAIIPPMTACRTYKNTDRMIIQVSLSIMRYYLVTSFSFHSF